MQRKLLSVVLKCLAVFSFCLFSGAASFGQATVVIENVTNACGSQANGSFQITVTAGIPPFSVVVFAPSYGTFVTKELQLGVPTIVDGLYPDNNVLSVTDNDPNPNYSTSVPIISVPEITGMSVSTSDNTDVTCVMPNGSISIDAITGGSGTYSFSWTGPNGFTSNAQNLTGLSGGDYVVTVTDQDAACSFVSNVFTIVDPVPSPFTISSGDLSICAGESVSVDLSVADPGVEYRLFVDGAATPATVTGPTNSITYGGLAPGSYTLSVRAALGSCTPIFSLNTLTLDVSAGPVSAVLSGDATICEGTPTDLAVTISGGAPPYSFTIDNGVGPITGYTSGTAISVTPNSTTAYQIVGNVVDANGCVVAGAGSATVTVSPVPVAVIDGGGAYCAGGTPLSVIFNFTGTPPFDFTYSDGSATHIVSGHPSNIYTVSTAAVGTYSITALTDAGGCAGADLGTPVDVIENPLPEVSNVSGGGTVCDGAALPDVTFTFAGTAPFNFSYTDGTATVPVNNHPSNTFTISGAAAGSYSVTALTDANGCSATDLGSSVNVVVNPLPSAAVSGGGEFCEGTPVPTVTFTFTGTAPFDFTYSNGVNNVQVNAHPTNTFVVNSPLPGSYSITQLSDATGCAAADLGTPVDVIENALPTVSAVAGGGAVCDGAALPDVTFTFTGAAPFNFTYTDGTTTVPVNNHPSNTYTITGAAVGSYSVTALTDAKGCSATDLGSSVDVIVNPLPTAVVSGGGEFCAGTAVPSVTFTFTGTAPFDFTYSDGTDDVQINGHPTNSFTLTSPSAGTYFITQLNDASGCPGVDLGTPVGVVENALPTAASAVTGGGSVCDGGTLPDVTFTFTGTAPFNFTYTNGTTTVPVTNHPDHTYTISGAAVGSYSVTALTDAKGCSATDLGSSVDVIVNPLPSAVISGGGEFCAGTTVPAVTFTFTGTAPFDFTYSDGTNDVQVTAHPTNTFALTAPNAGTYSITQLSDVTGCPGADLGTPVDVIENALPTATSAVTGGGTVCEGAALPDVTFTFTGTAPFNFTYSNGTTPVSVNNHPTTTYTITGAAVGSYSVTALTDAKGCSATDLGTAVEVIENPLPSAEISGGGEYCSGTTVPTVTFTFTGTAPFDFTYSDGTNDVQVNAHPNNTFTITSPTPGTYSITQFSDALGCAAVDLGTPVEVIENLLPTVNAATGGGAVCDGAALPDVTFTFTGTAPFNFTFTNGTTATPVNNHPTHTYTISGAAAGSYSITSLTDANGCAATDLGPSVDVIVNPLPSGDVGGGGITCDPGTRPDVTFVFTGTAPFDFTYSDGTVTTSVSGHNSNTFTLTNPAPGTYSLTALQDATGCVTNDLGGQASVEIAPVPTITAGPPATVCATDFVVLQGDVQNAPALLWSTAGDGEFDDPTDPSARYTPGSQDAANGSVVLTATAVGTCPGYSATVVITVNEAAIVDAGLPQTVCAGQSATLDAAMGGSATSLLWTTAGDGSFSDATSANATYTPGPADLANGSVILTATTNNPPGPCPAATSTVAVNFMDIPTDPSLVGNETWIGHVYDDAADPTPMPARIDFDVAKYRGFIESADISGMTAASSYDETTDFFDLNLEAADFISGPNVCGSYQNNFSIRYLMNKTFEAGVYRFTVGSDDGVRLFLDGVAITPAEGFDLQTYTLYTSDPVCLTEGVHALEIQYFENTGESRLSFSYERVAPVVTNAPIEVCVGATAPTLSASSTDADVLTYHWYHEGVHVFTGADFIPDASTLDMSVPGTTAFEVAAVYACGEAPRVTATVNVLDAATLILSDQQICASGGPVDLQAFASAVPAGGTFMFSGHAAISGTLFDPTGLAGNTIQVTVDYSTGACAASSGTLNLTITDDAVLDVPTAPVVLCESVGLIDLTTLVVANPGGGTFVFNGPQVTGNMFDPAGLSGLQVITVDYGVGACVASQAVFEVEVMSEAVLTTTNATVCANAGPLNLLTLVTGQPGGGTFTFTGAGVSGNFFDPTTQSGTIQVQVHYDRGGCEATGMININVRDASDPFCTVVNCNSVVVVPKTTPATCANSDGSMTLSIKPFKPNPTAAVVITVTGITTPVQYSKTIQNDSIFTHLPVGLYEYVIQYGDVCTLPGFFSIDRSGTVGPASVIVQSPPDCADAATGSVMIDVPGEEGNVLEWSLNGGGFTPFVVGNAVTGIEKGDHIIRIRRNNSDVCTSDVAFTMTGPDAITASFTITAATCDGNDGAIQGITVGGGSGTGYEWSIDGGLTWTTETNLTGLITGSYNLVVRDGNGCESVFTADVLSPGFVNTVITKSDANCSNEGRSGSISVNVVDGGQYFVALSTDQFNAPAEDEYVTYTNPALVFNNLARGQYFVYVKPATGSCPTRTAPIEIFGVYDITFDLQLNCHDNAVSLSLLNITGENKPGSGPLEIQVSRRLSTDPPSVVQFQFPANGELFLDNSQHAFLQAPGEYTLKILQVQSEVLCQFSSETVTFTVPGPLAANIQQVGKSYPDIPSGVFTVAGITGGAYPYDVRISLDSAASFALPFFETNFEQVGLDEHQLPAKAYKNVPPGRYQVEVQDALGCAIGLTARVPLDDELFIPTVFTPNGDGYNEVFYIRNLPTESASNELIITNRWGKQVYASTDYQNNWDGGDVADGVYFYRLRIGNGEVLTGWVEIMRGQQP